jgi:hypothetical protein
MEKHVRGWGEWLFIIAALEVKVLLILVIFG